MSTPRQLSLPLNYFSEFVSCYDGGICTRPECVAWVKTPLTIHLPYEPACVSGHFARLGLRELCGPPAGSLPEADLHVEKEVCEDL